MLIELFGRNFRSFKDEFRLSMVAADIDRDNPRGIIEVPLEGEEEPLRLLRCAAIYGPNASGKSTVLWAAAALWYLLTSSGAAASDQPIFPHDPFLLDDDSPQSPVMLGLRAVIERRVYEYAIEFSEREVIHERLLEIARDRDITLFTRNGQNVDGEWIDHEQFKLLTASFRPNALLLSLADSVAPDLAGGLAVGLRRILDRHDSSDSREKGSQWHYMARRAHHEKDEGFGEWLAGCLRAADVGIVNYETEELSDTRTEREVESPRKSKRADVPRYRISLVHSAHQKNVAIPYWLESRGTQKVAELAPFIYDLTHADLPKAMFVDEIGASMHPDLLRAMIRHFNCEVPQEQVRGQLIFATHETSLIDAEAKDAILRRDQVYLTEKGNDGASRLYSVAEFRERKVHNLRRRYLQGRYGALPSLGSFGD